MSLSHNNLEAVKLQFVALSSPYPRCYRKTYRRHHGITVVSTVFPLSPSPCSFPVHSPETRTMASTRLTEAYVKFTPIAGDATRENSLIHSCKTFLKCFFPKIKHVLVFLVLSILKWFLIFF